MTDPGLNGSEKFDVHKELEQFAKIITGYALMTDEELGLNTFIKRDRTGKYVVAAGTRDLLSRKEK